MNIVASIFLGALSNAPMKTAYIQDNATTSYQEAFRQVVHIARSLEDRGCDDSMIAAVSIENEALHYIVSLALLLIGAHQITFASHDGRGLKKRLLELVRPAVLITDSQSSDSDCQTILIEPGAIQTEANITDRQSLMMLAESYIMRSNGSVLLRTSGTTGGLNIVEVSASDFALQASRHPEYTTNSLLRLASIEHNNSKRHRLYAFFNRGNNVFRGGLGDQWLTQVAAGFVSILDISRLHIIELLDNINDGRLATLKIRTGGSAIPLELRQSVMQNITQHLFVRYAATEFGGIAMAGPDMHIEHGSAGMPLNGVDVQIVDDNDALVANGQIGQIRLSAPGASKRYIFSESPNQAQERFRNGFFYPGDMGWIHPTGQLIVAGRKDHMMIMNGLNIFPDEIESTLLRIPGVSEAACFAFESRQHGQIPVAAVVLKKNSQQAESMLIASAKNMLGLKYPRRIIITSEIPLNSAGKYDTRKLVERFISKGQKA